MERIANKETLGCHLHGHEVRVALWVQDMPRTLTSGWRNKKKGLWVFPCEGAGVSPSRNCTHKLSREPAARVGGTPWHSSATPIRGKSKGPALMTVEVN